MLLLRNLLKTVVQKGRLRIYDAGGTAHEFGPNTDGPSVTARLHKRALEWRLFFNPELYAAEAYMDGTLTFEDGSTVYDLLFLFSINRAPFGRHPVQGLIRRGWKAVRRLQQYNSMVNAKAQARFHYDISTDLYRLFLDEGLNYTCGYFRSPDDGLEEAQRAKITHIVAKLNLQPGMRVLELGCGWGSLAIALARAGAHVMAVNVSPEQMAVARERVAAAGLTGRIELVIKDYRECEGAFDRIVAVGLLEHVGAFHYDAFFTKVRALLAPGGYALIHSGGRMTPPGTTAPFYRKYIFPGGYLPSLEEVFAAAARTGLWVADMEVLRLHYVYTIRHWSQRFQARRDEARALYDERFCRMWEFYLAAAELGFLHGANMVFQLLVSVERDAAPIVRDFIVDDERALLADQARVAAQEAMSPRGSPASGAGSAS